MNAKNISEFCKQFASDELGNQKKHGNYYVEDNYLMFKSDSVWLDEDTKILAYRNRDGEVFYNSGKLNALRFRQHSITKESVWGYLSKNVSYLILKIDRMIEGY